MLRLYADDLCDDENGGQQEGKDSPSLYFSSAFLEMALTECFPCQCAIADVRILSKPFAIAHLGIPFMPMRYC